MRQSWMLLMLTGCVLGEQQTTFFDDLSRQSAEVAGRFAGEAEFGNPGYGIVPVRHGTAAMMGMEDRVCEVTDRGRIAEDIFIDGGIAPGYVLLDGDGNGWLAADDSSIYVTGPWGEILSEYPVDGDVLGGEITEDGVFVLVSNDDGCFVLWIHPDGTQELIEVDAETCQPEVDIETGPDGGVLIGGPSIVAVTPVGVEVVADGQQVSSDTSTGLWYSGTPGKADLTVHHPDGATEGVALPSGLVDFAARGSQVVLLTEDLRLVHIETESHTIVANEPYFGPMGMERLQLTGDGTGIVLNGPNLVKFYSLRLDREPAALPGFEDDGRTGQAQGQ